MAPLNAVNGRGIRHLKPPRLFIRAKFHVGTARRTIDNTDDVPPVISFQRMIDIKTDDHFCHVDFASDGGVRIGVIRIQHLAEMQISCQWPLHQTSHLTGYDKWIEHYKQDAALRHIALAKWQ